MALDKIHQKFLDSWKEFVTWVSENVDSDYKFSIFGGALRDEIAGLSQYNDIDLYIGEDDFALPKSYIGTNILDYLPKNKLKILNLDKFKGSFEFQPTLYGDNLEKDSFTFEVEDLETKERASIKVDFVKSTEELKHPSPNYGKNLDADVNSLYYHNGEVKSTLRSSCGEAHINLLKANIEKGKYFRTNSCRSDRTKKLKNWAEKVSVVKFFEARSSDNKTEIALEAAKAQGLEVKNLSSKDIDLSGYPPKKEEMGKVTREEIIEAIRAKKFADFSFEGKNLSGQNLSGLNFWGKNFKGANLKGANLSRSCLEGVDFQGANIEDVNFNQAIFDKDSIWADIASSRGFEIREVDLSGNDVKKEEKKNMAKKTVIERNVESMNAAIYLGGAMKIEDLAQKLILAIAAKAGLNDSEMGGIHKILKHELFGCALSVGIGNAIPVIPGLENNLQAEKLADNMRVLGYAKAGVTGVNALLDKLLPEDCSGLIEQVNNIVGSLPAAEKVRVADEVDVEFEEEENVKSNVSSLRVANGRNRLG